MILVTGATGTIGRLVVRRLIEQGAEVKALVRDRSRGESLGVECVVGDFDAPETVQAAMSGVRRVFLNGVAGESMVSQQTAAIDAAKAAGVTQIVRISTAGADAESGMVVARWQAELDAYLAESGVGWSVLRPTFFMQNLRRNAEGVREHGRIFGAFGAGRIAFVDCEDIAGCAARLLTEPIRRGRSYVLTGREALSFSEIASKLAARLGKPVVYVDRPVSEIVERMKSNGIPPRIAESLGTMMGSMAKDGASALSGGVEEILGRAPRSLDEFLTDNLDEFR